MKQAVRIIPFLDQAVEGFEQGLDFILTDSVNTSELEASFDEAYARLSRVSSGFSTPFVLFLILPNCSLFLASQLMIYRARPELCFAYSTGR